MTFNGIHTAPLIAAIIGAAVFLILRERPYFKARPLIKAVMGIMLALYCVYAPSVPLYVMAAGFALSALGDFFLDIPDDKGFLPGLGAFFAAHIAFLAYLWPHMIPLPQLSPALLGVFGLLFVGNAWFYLWLRPTLEPNLRVPVAAYSSIIALMGMAAIGTTLPSYFVPLGALLFIASRRRARHRKIQNKIPVRQNPQLASLCQRPNYLGDWGCGGGLKRYQFFRQCRVHRTGGVEVGFG